MASNIGTNFSYRAHKFLDDRQDFAKSKQDLKNWTIPVPEAFEICLEGNWYYYDSTIDLEDTGHWVPKIQENIEDIVDDTKQSLSAKSVVEMSKDVKNMKDEMVEVSSFTSSVSISGLKISTAFESTADIRKAEMETMSGVEDCISSKIYNEKYDINNNGVVDETDKNLWIEFFKEAKESLSYLTPNNSTTYWLELGSEIVPKNSWKLIRPKINWTLNGSTVTWKVIPGTDKNEVTPTKSTVGTEIKGYLDEETKTSWTAKNVVSSNTRKTYRFDIYSEFGGDSLFAVGYTYLKFAYRNYTGVGGLDVWNKDIIDFRTEYKSFTKRFTDYGNLSEVKFNCSGGKYPYILIPTELYSPNYKTYVNKNLNSDFLIKDIKVINDRGLTLNYKLYRTNYIQTGSSIGIEIK